MKHFIIILFLFSIQNCFPQEILISSKNDKKPIAFANVVYLKNDSIKGGNYTNENGKIVLDLKPEINFIEISCVGFATLKIERKNIQSNIFLEENATQMQEIVIGDKKLKTKYLGLKMKPRILYFSMLKGLETITFIKNDFNEEKLIKTFNFYLRKRMKELAVLRIVCYKKQNNVLEKINIDGKKSVFKIKKGGKLKLDIRDLNITLPKEGIFIGIEYLGFVDEKLNEIISTNYTKEEGFWLAIPFTTSPDTHTYNSYMRSNFLYRDWENMNDKNNRIYVIREFYKQVKDNENLVPTFGIEIYE